MEIPREAVDGLPARKLSMAKDGGVGKGDVKHKRVLISHSQERVSARWKVREAAAR